MIYRTAMLDRDTTADKVGLPITGGFATAILLGMAAKGQPVYEKSVSPAAVAERRSRARTARASRKRNRRK